MADLNVSAKPRTANLPKSNEAPEAFAPSDVINEITSAQKRLEKDRIEAQHPGAWTRFKEVFSPGSKRAREARIKSAEKMDKIIDDLYRMIFSIYQGLINPQASNS